MIPSQNGLNPKLRAFLDLIAFSEGTITGLDGGYGVIVSGVDGPHSFTNYSDHPFAYGGSILFREPDIPANRSTAAGRYQLLARWWRSYKIQLGLSDFSPKSQDAVALKQISDRGAIPMIDSGNIQGAITACSNIWASFPGNGYGQGGHSMEVLLAKYDALFVTPEAA